MLNMTRYNGGLVLHGGQNVCCVRRGIIVVWHSIEVRKCAVYGEV